MNRAKIDWSQVALSDLLPEPPADRGILATNTEEALKVTLPGVSDRQYQKYLDACIERGFSVDAEKTSAGYSALDADGYSLSLRRIDDRLIISLSAPIRFETISWPTSTVRRLLPVPESAVGKFAYEFSDGFAVTVANTSKADYDRYVADCSDCGFNVDYDKGGNYYYAYHPDGYYLMLEYLGSDTMSVIIESPIDGTPDKTAPTAPTTEAPPASSDALPLETEAAATSVETDGLRPAFKDAMDSYEAFMDEYIALMKKTEENPEDLGLLADYMEYLGKYADVVEKFDAWENEDLNDAELVYYIEVQTRVTQKLLAAASN